MSQYAKVAVLFVSKDPALAHGESEITCDIEEGILTLRGYFGAKGLKGKIQNLFRNRKLHDLAYGVLLEKWGAKPDIVDLNILARPDFFANRLWRKHQIPYVITERWSGFLPQVGAYRGILFKLITRSNVRNARAIITVSGFLANHMQKLGLNHANYQVIHNVVDIPNPVERSKKDKIDGSPAFRLAHISILNDSIKNVSDIIRAVSSLIEQGHQLELHILGEGPDREDLESLARALGTLDSKVIFYGYRSNDFVHELLQSIDLVVVNSRFETFSIVPIEAMANGKPVISTRCGGPEEYMKPEHGELIPIDDPQALQAAILKMKTRLKEIEPKRLRQFVLDNFSYKVIGKQYLDLYQEVIADCAIES